MTNKVRITLLAVLLFVCFGAASAQLPKPLPKAQSPATQVKGLTNPSPELVGKLTKELSVTPEQATGGAGALFGLAKSKLKPEDFTKVADVVPGMDGLLKATPKPKKESSDMLSSVGSMLPGKAGALASVAGSFKELGMSPDMAVKFLPIMTKFVDLKGGAGVAKILSGALK
jgi:hypothetical protein